MGSWFWPDAPSRASEVNAAQLAATGASLGGHGVVDPIDGDTGWARMGSGGPRGIPLWTLEKLRAYSVNAYRANPMAKAIIDTYTSFCVGDSGVTWQADNDAVHRYVEEFWQDPRNKVGEIQPLMFRDALINGEQLLELMVGTLTGVTRFCPVAVESITEITNLHGNPLWPDKVLFRRNGTDTFRRIAAVDDHDNLRAGQALWFAPWKTTLMDVRSQPFLSTVLDQLDSYDTVLSNLVDRTALARYLVWTVKVNGDAGAVATFVRERGGLHAPPSGSIEVHNDQVEWKPQTAQTGAYEDSKAAASVLTEVAAGAGLSKVWLAEPEDANRATSQSMAEPVRRRIQGVQGVYLNHVQELVRFAVDQGVRAGRLPRLVKARNPKSGEEYEIPAAMSVRVSGPEVAAADAQISAQTLLNLATGIKTFIEHGVMTPEAAKFAARKAWEEYMGVPYVASLDSPDANADDVATHVEATQKPEATETSPLARLSPGYL
ncbi:hypothetical protein [Lentzea sp. NBRC 102530]|uniref:hypothetical protein n=1 Tax=Lentzea sp. NBRC 102530 TaxID=3032201 RepID=UPI0024A5B767|nr:hypothetical protein [Lentzea sp. NBRC 102530]GLY55212.1 hypothetical protein Lesp01_88670 [Lentzea sp. NBRC 102530]